MMFLLHNKYQTINYINKLHKYIDGSFHGFQKKILTIICEGGLGFHSNSENK